MRTCNATFVLILFTALCMANEEGFSRYQVILEKQIFGQAPPDEDVFQVQASESFARHLRLSMLFEGADGTIRAGLVDSSDESQQKNYILRIGEPENGLEMVEADIKTSEALIRKGQEVALFKLEASSGQPIAQQEQNSRMSSYAERRRAQMQRLEDRAREQQENPPPETRLTGEALRKHLEEVQMDAIRNGLPPLPMQLTPEMDAQLVEEGILPPQEEDPSSRNIPY